MSERTVLVAGDASGPRAANQRPKPFLRWVGGKQQLVHRLKPYLPADVESRVYREPFLGGGSLFFALSPAKAFLSDANEHLMMCYEYVRDRPDLVADYLAAHGRQHNRQHYYAARRLYNKSRASAAQAARFIYLNRACYNGVFRVNEKGEFNVPFGREPKLLTRATLRSIGAVLAEASICHADYGVALRDVGKKDFVYLDPPYPPLNGTSYFTHYTPARFGRSDQEALADAAKRIDKVGAPFMLTIADTPLARQLYGAFDAHVLRVRRFVTCKAARHVVRELVITNYEVRA